MVMETPVIASPFPISNIGITQSSFRNSLVYGSTSKGSSLDVGGGAGFTVKEALYSSVGEYLERLTQRKPSHKIHEEFLSAYNINLETVEKIPLGNVLLFDPRIFNPNADSDWNDSTGTAFHTNTLDLIESSFFEFIERQSLVFNWLTKTPGKKIKLKNFYERKRIKQMSLSLSAYFDTLDLFEISIHPSCYVVICIGTGEFCKSVGMGVGWNISDAIYGSLKENLQCVSHMVPSHQSDINPEALKVFESFEEPESDMYYEKYFESLSPKQLSIEYSYLFKPGLELIELTENRRRPSYDEYLSILKNISEDLSIELLICFIPSLIENLPGSVIRLIGKGAFPHIKTDELNPFLYSINGINKLSTIEVPNIGKMVPFN